MGTSTQYVRNGDVSLAYQVTGEGPVDLVVVSGFISHLELEWSNPFYIEYLRGLNSFARVIRFDKRGTGLSDPVPGVPSFEDRMEDVRVVMDAVGIERAALYGLSEGGPMSMLFAATYPERVSALVLYGTFACGQDLGDASFMNDIVRHWGEGRLVERFCPSLIDDQNARRMVGTYERSAASPGMVRALLEGVANVDARDILGSIQVPTLVIHRRDDMVAPIEAGRRVAEGIPGAEFVELPGNDHAPFIGDRDALTQTIEEFLTGNRQSHEVDRVLATVLFTDIVGSTERAAEMGDAAWRALLERHDSIARHEVERARGRVVKSLGDGMLATFDGPARAIRCAEAIRNQLEPLGVEIRAGVHTGECETIGTDDLGGLAVHIGARVSAKASAGEVLVSSTVKDLVVGSSIGFEDAGEHDLKGVPGSWRLYRVGAGREAPAIAAAADHMTFADRTTVRLSRRAPGMMRALARMTVKERALSE